MISYCEDSVVFSNSKPLEQLSRHTNSKGEQGSEATAAGWKALDILMVKLG